MRRAAGIFTTVILGAGALTAGTSPAVAGIDGNRFQVTARTVSEHYNDVGRKGESVGDSYTFTDKLFHNGERVGRDAVGCDLIRVARRSFSLHCVGTLVLRSRGSLAVQGVVTYRRGDRSWPQLAITGGTGDYAGASGVMTLIERRGEPTRYRIRLFD